MFLTSSKAPKEISMNYPNRSLLAALTATLLSACAGDGVAPLQSGPLTQQDVSESIASVSQQLGAALTRAAHDEGIVALQGFPQVGVMSNPFFGYGVTLMSAKHPERAKGALRAFADFNLPDGVYTFRERDGAATWVFEGESNDLTLNWTYDADPETAADDEAEATMTFDWDAQSPTVEVASPSGESVEVPTGLNLTLLANGVSAADVDMATTYYQAPGCGDGAGILEPTSLTVDGAGSLLRLENVGYSVRESGVGDSFVTQGKVTLLDDGISFDWNLAVNGDLERSENCFSESLSLDDGSVALTLAGLSGDTRSASLRFSFDGLGSSSGPNLSNGAVVVNGDEGRAVTFSGSLADSNANGVPGDDLTVRFPDGSTRTLEQIITDWSAGNRLMQYLRR
jgi:hypothetical protein